MLRLVALPLAALALAGCLTVGPTVDPFDLAQADQLTPGTSTVADATKLFGEPASETSYADGTTLVQWSHLQDSARGPRSALLLAVLFDRDGKMIRVSHRTRTRIG